MTTSSTQSRRRASMRYSKKRAETTLCRTRRLSLKSLLLGQCARTIYSTPVCPNHPRRVFPNIASTTPISEQHPGSTFATMPSCSRTWSSRTSTSTLSSRRNPLFVSRIWKPMRCYAKSRLPDNTRSDSSHLHLVRPDLAQSGICLTSPSAPSPLHEAFQGQRRDPRVGPGSRSRTQQIPRGHHHHRADSTPVTLPR